MPENQKQMEGGFFPQIEMDLSNCLGLSLDVVNSEDILVEFQTDLFLLRLLHYWLMESNEDEFNYYQGSFENALYLCLERLHFREKQLEKTIYSE